MTRIVLAFALCGCDLVFGTTPIPDASPRSDSTVDVRNDDAAVTGIQFVRGSSGSTVATVTNISATLDAVPNGATIVVQVAWGGSGTVMTLTDTAGDSFASMPPMQRNMLHQQTYYVIHASGGSGAAVVVTANFSTTTSLCDVRASVYTGANSLGSYMQANGNGVIATTQIDVTHPGSLVVAGAAFGTSSTGPGPGFTQRLLVNATGSISEDRLVAMPATIDAQAPQSMADDWVITALAFAP